MNGRILAVVLIVLIFGSVIGGVFYFSAKQDSVEQSAFGESSEPETLDFCTDVAQCVSVLKSEGMPDGYLEENGITISCASGVCRASK